MPYRVSRLCTEAVGRHPAPPFCMPLRDLKIDPNGAFVEEYSMDASRGHAVEK